MPPPQKEKSPIKEFELELAKVTARKPPMSKSLVQSLTSLAVSKYVKYFKLIVYAVEKFIHKARTDFKVPGLYIIDAILQASRKKYGDKDMYVDRFGKNLNQTFEQLLRCKTEDKEKIAKVVRHWQSLNFYDEETLAALIPTSRGPEAVKQLGGEDDTEAPLDGGHAAELIEDDFDYGSDEDDESRIAEQQRMLAEGKRAVKEAPLASSGSGVTSVLSELKKAPITSEFADTSTAILPPLVGQGADLASSIQSLLSEAKAESATHQPSQAVHGRQHGERPAHPQNWQGMPGHSAQAPLMGPPGGGSVPFPRGDPGQSNVPRGFPGPALGQSSNGPGHASAPQAAPLRVLSKTLRLKGMSRTVGEVALQSVLSQMGPVSGLWLTDESTREWTCLMGRRQDAERAFRELPSEGLLRGVTIEWIPGEGQSKYLDASGGWKNWDPSNGILMLPLSAVTSGNISSFCAGSVIDRQTAPRDMLPDLDRHERPGESFGAHPTQMGNGPPRGGRDPSGRLPPQVHTPRSADGPAAGHASGPGPRGRGDGGWRDAPRGESVGHYRDSNRPNPHSVGPPASGGQFAPRRDDHYGMGPGAVAPSGQPTMRQDDRGQAPQARYPGHRGQHDGGWENDRKRGVPGSDGQNDGAKRQRQSRWGDTADAAPHSRRI